MHRRLVTGGEANGRRVEGMVVVVGCTTVAGGTEAGGEGGTKPFQDPRMQEYRRSALHRGSLADILTG